MTRTRKPAGRIAFVGAGPGDPGLLTRRAHQALADADQVVYDRAVPDSLLDALRAGAKEDAQFSPAEGAPGDVAKVLPSGGAPGGR
jgi:uroporphyrinogen III methyltransferase/synthase